MHASMVNGRSTVFGAMLWMLGLSFLLTLLLSWVPFVGPFIGPIVGGYVGGRRARTAGNAIVAALLPALLLFLFIVGLGALASILGGTPVIGAVAAVFAGTAVLIAVSHNAALMVAALVGGLMSQAETS
jgi:hypothetical protein